MEDMKTRFNPYFAQVRDNAQAKITTLNEMLKSQLENIKEKIQVTAEDIKDRFEETTEGMQDVMKEKIVELQVWFQPLVSMFSSEM